MPHTVFISYSSKDKAVADAVCTTLEARQMPCWIAPRNITPGMDWSDAIIDGLTACRVFVLILSSASNFSEQVKREVQNAVGDGIPVLPFRIEDFHLSKHMRYFIGTPHWLDAISGSMEEHLQLLASTVESLLATATPDEADQWEINLGQRAGPVPVPAPEPRRLDAGAPVTGTGNDSRTPRVDAGPEPLTPRPHPPSPRWDAGVIKQLESHLAAAIGPLAKVLVKQAAATTASMDVLSQRLAEDIPPGRERERFLDRCRQLASPPDATPAPAVVQPASGGGAADLGPAGAPAHLPVGTGPTGGAAVAGGLDEATLRVAERQLAEYIGPLARVLVKKSAAKAATRSDLYTLLSAYIPTEKEKRQFLETSLKQSTP